MHTKIQVDWKSHSFSNQHLVQACSVKVLSIDEQAACSPMRQNQLHVLTYLADAQALDFDHLDDLQLEVGIEDPLDFGLLTVHAISVFNNLSGCLFLLNLYSPGSSG